MLERKWDGFFTHPQTNKQNTKGPRNKFRDILWIKCNRHNKSKTTCHKVQSRHSQRSTGQYPGVRWQTRRTQSVPQHHRVILNDVQGMQSRPSYAMIQRQGSQHHQPCSS